MDYGPTQLHLDISVATWRGEMDKTWPKGTLLYSKYKVNCRSKVLGINVD